ncbi:coiled-coil domain-containing 58 [Lycorma delicatula]|uniref:coiled-coil domain-containing 58 n=1 Tax=Lycorma delicatula TaxID=130591 RepID=UPI003F50DC1E
MQCVDFLEFQDVLKKMRDLDDKIIYTLNTTIPTTATFRSQIDPSKTCQDLYSKILTNYNKRETAIKDCIVATSDRIKDLKEQNYNKEDLKVNKALKSEQTKLRLLKSELNVEEVVRERTFKVYYERCRQFYKPADLNL